MIWRDAGTDIKVMRMSKSSSTAVRFFMGYSIMPG